MARTGYFHYTKLKQLFIHILLFLFLLNLSTAVKAQALPESRNAESGSGPFVETLWGQVNCKDENNILINVTNLYTPKHYAAGCVAISLASLMHHYRWPLTGTGSNSYTDSHGSSTGIYSADFENTSYDMNLMLSEYNHLESSSTERYEAGKLAFHSAVALDMDFEQDGSTSNVNKIPKAAANYFRYYGFYKEPDSPVFWDLLDENMEQQVAVILAIEASNGAAHSIICDGLQYNNDKAYYHLNMGWWGASNGWYPLRDSWSAGGYNKITGAVFDLIPCPAMNEVEYLSSEQLNLSWIYPDQPISEGYELQHREKNGSWEALVTDHMENSYLATIDPGLKHSFRVRAKVFGEYYPSAWSNISEHIPASSAKGVTENGIRVYPVPVGEILHVEGLESSGGSLHIYASDGSLVYLISLEDAGDKLKIQTRNWSPGVYLLNITGGENKVVKRIIKTKN